MSAETPRAEPTSPGTVELLARHRAGDAAALDHLMRAYYPRVTRIVRVRLGNAARQRELVEDVVQDVFVRVLQGLEGFEQRSDARWIDWVARIAQNNIANLVRREHALKRDAPLRELVRSAAQSAAELELAAHSTGVPSKVARKELEERVDAAVAELAPAHREVVLLRDYAGEEWSAIAVELERSTPEACQELHRRARRELKRKLALEP